MNIKIVCVGKIKESYFSQAVAEYVKRLSAYGKIEITEVADEKTKEGASDNENALVIKREGVRILEKLSEREYVIALAINGKRYSSEDFAAHLNELGVRGQSRLVFVIGGSLGLSDEVLKRADERISFSDMTFPHQLMRVILTEQVYRAFRIMNHEPYHK